MAGIAAGEREEAAEGAEGGARLAPELLQAIADEVNVLRRDPKGYAEELAYLDRSVSLRECVHDLRSAKPMPELTLSQAISRACQRHLADLAAHAHQSHVGTDGSTPEVRLSGVGAHREQCGENLAFGAGSARDVVHQMLLDDASAERSQRANLLNPDFRYLGAAQGEHPSAGTVTVLLFTDNFRAKQASHADTQRAVLADVLGPEARATRDAAEGGDESTQRSWDHLMQQAKPAHLQVPPRQRAHVEFLANPKLYGQDRVRVPRVPTGDLQPRPSVDPAVVRAFVFRLDADQDDLITERDLEALCYRKQLDISQAEIAEMTDEIVQRRQACERDRRSLDYAEVCGAMQPLKHWVPVTDIHVQRADDAYQLIVDSEVLDQWSRELHDEFAAKCEGLASPASGSKGRSRNHGAEVRVAELNSFLASVLAASVSGTGTPLQQEPQVAAFLGRPLRAPGPALPEAFCSAVCLGQRRLWAYRLRPHREAWLRLFRAAGLQPLVPLGAADGRTAERPAAAEEASPARSRNAARTPQRYFGIAPGAEKMAVRDAPQKVKVRADKTGAPLASAASTLQPWQDKQQQLENSVNSCINLEGSTATSGSSPCIGFEAQRKFAQVLCMQKHGADAGETAHELDGEPDALTRELGLSRRSRGPGAPAGPTATTRRGPGGSAPPAVHRGHGAGSHSLSAHDGVRSHFHNTTAIHQWGGSQSGLSVMDARWEGSHLDHAKLPPQKADARFSVMAQEERARQFSTYFKGAAPDCAALKAQTACGQARDAEAYQEWTKHEFRSDVPHRHGKHGRRHFDPQVREKPIYNRHFISEIESKPHEEFERHAERVQDYLYRKLPHGQERHFQLYLPRSQQPSKYEELATRQPVRSANVDGVVKRNDLGFGQMRHSGPGDPRLHTRPLGASQMDRLIPLA